MTKCLARICALALLLGSSMFMLSCSGNNNDNGNVSKVTANANPSPVATAAAKPPNYSGAVDTVNCTAISGWVWNSANASEDIKADFYVDGKLVGTVPAKNPRPDLKGIGTGNYGFGLPVPPELKDGNPHTVNVKVAGSDYNIKVWEKIQPTFTCR